MSQAGVLNANQGSGGLFNLQKVIVQAGTSPVLVSPTNSITFNGMVAPAGSIPVFTDGTAPYTMALEVQTSQAIASTDATKIGLAAFNSADFTVDSNGFVTLAGSAAVETFEVDAFTAPGTNPVVPNGSGMVTITGGQIAAGTTSNVIRTDSLAANTYTIQVQRSTAAASSTIGDNGVAHFNSAQFSVDGNGFVSATGSVPIQFTASDATTATPSSGNLNLFGTGSITTTASGSTVTTEFTGLTNHAVLVGAGSATITKVGPTATSGQVLQSQGSSSDPAFSTATYPSTTTVNQLLYSSSANVVGGLATGNNGVLITSASGVPSILADGTTGQVLTATTGSPPSWSTIVTGVSSVTGTANQIQASPTTGNVVISLIGPYTPATYTAHGVLVGEGTSSIVAIAPTANTGAVLQNNFGADPSYSTATYPSTTTINQILYSSAANTVTGLATANNAVLTTGTGGVPVLTALISDGQIIIGSSAGAPAAATLTAGTGISILNGHNSVTISSSGTTVLTVTPLTYASSPYTVLSTDDFLAITGSVGTFTVKLPNAPTTGRVIIIKDTNGVAATDNIAVTTVGGTVTIDGQTTYTINTNYESISLIFDGTNYEIF